MSSDFDWLKEYGPHWEPGSLAFWLAPGSAEDMVAWLMKYRPETLPVATAPSRDTAAAYQQHLIASQQFSALQQAQNPYTYGGLRQVAGNSLAKALGL